MRIVACSTLSHLIRTAAAVAGCALAVQAAGPSGVASMPASAPTADHVALPSTTAIQKAVRELNHPSLARRQAAVQQLTGWGPLAFDELSKAAAGPDLEAALRARDLLDEMGEVLFLGSQVCLSVDRARIRWDEPIALTLEVHNPTAGQVMLPWPLRTAGSRPAEDDAHQVGAMMDLADFLTVTGPDGQEVQLRVDPVEMDTAVYQILNVRAGDHPPTHALAPGATDGLVASQFNRGWARFPILTRGRYVVRFAYQPEWKDPNWTEHDVGLVQSEPLVIEVTESAPAEIQQADRPLQLVVRRDADKLIGELVNRWDRELWLNLNINGPMDTHARLEWHAVVGGAEDAEVFRLAGDATGVNFSADRLVRLAPGERTTISKVSVDEVRKLGRDNSPEPATKSMVMSLHYTQTAAPGDLRKVLRAKGRRDNIPTQMFSGAVIGEPIEVTK